MSVDVEADIAAYARQQRAERERQWRANNPDLLRQNRANARARNKIPIPIIWEAPPERTNRIPTDYRVHLDARISRCAGCDQWCWDRRCNHCMTQINRRTAA